MTRFSMITAVAATVVTFTPRAFANIEPPPAYDARSVGMGSTGVAHVSNGASLYHNPAALHGVERGAVTGVFSPLAPQLTAPLDGPDTSVKSKRDLGPLFLVGGAYRVHERVVLGVAAFPTMGFGAEYQDLDALGGLDLSASLGVLEIAPGAAFGITDDIAVGLAYRASYFSYSASSPVLAPPPAPAGTLLSAEADLSAWNFTGLHAGVFARVTPSTRLGLSYRSKISADLDGTTDIGGQELDTTLEFSVPHIFKLGVAQGLLDDRLLLALDLRYALYKDANESLVVETTVPGVGTQEQETPLDWHDSIGVYLGGEYRVHDLIRVRAGYSLASSATPEETVQPILPPPGLQHTIHAGAGVDVGGLEVDMGGYYLMGGQNAEPDPASGNAPGDYKFDAILGSVSVTYRFGAAATASEADAPKGTGGAT